MITITYKELSARISTHGAELHALCQGEKNLLWGRDPAIWDSSAPLLFPICGRLREGKYTLAGKEYTLSPHGFAKTADFTVKSREESRVVLELRDSAATRAVYPFAFCLEAEYELGEDGLHFTFRVHNRDQKQMYYSLGGHWGFALEEDLSAYALHFDQKVTLDREILDGAFLSGEVERVLTNSEVLPLDYRICDNDTYVFKNVPAACTLFHGEKPVVRLEYPDTPHLLLWTKPGQKYLCIEPWNGMPDGKESGPLEQKDSIHSLAPAQSASFVHKILIK